MPKRGSGVCGYKGCEEEAYYIVEVDGRSIPLCREHYRSLLRKLEAKAAESGSASLAEISVLEGEEGVSSLSSRRAKK